MMQLKLGVDNGNYNTKASERMLYASGFTMSEKEFITDDSSFCMTASIMLLAVSV
jgi:hypothetical protein